LFILTGSIREILLDKFGNPFPKVNFIKSKTEHKAKLTFHLKRVSRKKMSPKKEAASQQDLTPAERASRALTVAKRNFQRSTEIMQEHVDQECTPANLRKGETLMKAFDLRYEEYQAAYDEFEIYFESPEGVNEERKKLQHVWTDSQIAYEQWSGADRTKKELSNSSSTMNSMYGIHFSAKKIMGDRKFDGKDLRQFPQFRVQWKLADDHMTKLNYSGAMKLIELKKCLDGRALDTVKQLPLEDGNYDSALKILDQTYKRPIRFAELIVQDLLQAPAMTLNSASIEATLNAIEQANQALTGLNLSREQAGELLFYVICESKLHTTVLRDWTKIKEKHRSDAHPAGHSATLEDLIDVIRTHKEWAEKMEERKPPEKQKSEADGPHKSGHSKNRATIQGSFVAREKTDFKCLICEKSGHRAEECFAITKAKSNQDRRRILEEKKVNLCWNCLKGKHLTKDCRQPPQCEVPKCGKKHHTMLHLKTATSAPATVSRALNEERSLNLGTEESNTVAAATAKPLGNTPILQTCKAWAISPSGEKYMATVFLDSGSEMTMIRQSLAKKMGLEGPGHRLNLTGVGGVAIPPTNEKVVHFRLQSLSGDYESPSIKAVTKESLTDTIRSVNIDPKNFEHLKNLEFTEDFPKKPSVVDILIGVADYGTFLTGSIVRGLPNEPVALKTKLGLVLSGSA